MKVLLIQFLFLLLPLFSLQSQEDSIQYQYEELIGAELSLEVIDSLILLGQNIEKDLNFLYGISDDETEKVNQLISIGKRLMEYPKSIEYPKAIAYSHYFMGLEILLVNNYREKDNDFGTDIGLVALSSLDTAASLFEQIGERKSQYKALHYKYHSIYIYEYTSRDTLESDLIRLNDDSGLEQDSFLLTKSLFYLGKIAEEKYKYYKAIKYFENSIEILNSMPEFDYVLMYKEYNYFNIALIYQKLGFYQKSIEYFEISKELEWEMKDTLGVLWTMASIGNHYNLLEEYETTAKVIESINKLEENYKIEDISVQIVVNKLKGNYFSNILEFEKSKMYYEKIREIEKHYLANGEESSGIMPFYFFKSYINLAYVEEKLGNEENIEQYYLKAYSYAKKNEYLQNLLEASTALEQYYNKINDNSKVQFYQNVKNGIADRFLKESLEKQIHQMKFDFDISEAENNIEELNYINQLNQSQLKNRSRLLLIVFLLLFLSFIFVLGLRNRMIANKKIQKLTNERNQSLEIMNREIEEKKQILEKSNHNLTHFAQIAAHDIKGPLQTISLFANLLNQKYSTMVETEDQAFFDFIVSGCNTLTELTDGLLKFSEVSLESNYQKEKIEMNDLVDNVKNMLSLQLNEKNGKIIIENPLHSVEGQGVLIQRLLLNLVSNAIKFSKKEIPLVIRISSEIQDKEQLRFKFEDNGIGIEKKHLNDIFMLFKKLHSQEKYGGSGIGLATCTKIVQKHNGRIWVESEIEVGTVFYFTLPIWKD